jgi:hypothetical protein
MLTIDIIELKVHFLPLKQKKFLKKLINRSGNDKAAVAAVNAIINIIVCVEKLFLGKGQEILKGAHLVIKDKGIHKKLKSDTATRGRISSHYRGNKEEEFGVNLPSTADFLVGLNRDGISWLQIENSKVSFEEGIIYGAGLVLLHILDYLYYKFTGKNVGPCGLSQYTESNPIKLQNVEALFNEMDENNEISNSQSFTDLVSSKSGQSKSI